MTIHSVQVGRVTVKIDDNFDRDAQRKKIAQEQGGDELSISIEMLGRSGVAKDGFFDIYDSVEIKIGNKTYDVNARELIEFLARAGNGSTRQPAPDFDRFEIADAMDRLSLIPEKDLIAFVEGRVQYLDEGRPVSGTLRTEEYYTYRVVDKKDMAPDGTVKSGRIGGYHPGSARFAPKAQLKVPPKKE